MELTSRESISINTRKNYDLADFVTHTHQVDGNAPEILVQNTYNEISQLSNKKVGGTSASNPLQSIDYQYNIRGWMVNFPVLVNFPVFVGFPKTSTV